MAQVRSLEVTAFRVRLQSLVGKRRAISDLQFALVCRWVMRIG